MIEFTIRSKTYNPVQLAVLVITFISLVGTIVSMIGISHWSGGISAIAEPAILAVGLVAVVQAIMAYGMYKNTKGWALAWVFYGPIYFIVVAEITWELVTFNQTVLEGSKNNGSPIPAIVALVFFVLVFVWNRRDVRKRFEIS